MFPFILSKKVLKTIFKGKKNLFAKVQRRLEGLPAEWKTASFKDDSKAKGGGNSTEVSWLQVHWKGMEAKENQDGNLGTAKGKAREEFPVGVFQVIRSVTRDESFL